MIVRFGYWLVLLTVCCVTLANSEVYTDEVEFDNNTFVDNVPFQSDCDCGLYAKFCFKVGEKKTCVCDDLYADKQGTCEACDCNGKYGCEFDNHGWKKCTCPKGYVQLNEECRKCDCGEHGKCKLYDFGKLCECEKGYKLKTSVVYSGICEECDCGEHGICSFSAEYKQCSCDSKFAENDFGKCEACDCGENASCTFNDEGKKQCDCSPGFAEIYRGKCEACDCGENARCTFNAGKKQCVCKHGFAENFLGKCKECDCKMDDSNCTIDGFAIKKCQCPKGFEQSKDNPVCIEKDECLSPEDNDCDPISTKCVHTRGSYDCVCQEGFQIIYNILGYYDIKKDGCKDIDECLDYSPCIHLHTRCVNTPGSYKCECTAGYSLEKDSYAEKYNYCSEGARPWKTASIVVGCLFGFVSLGLLIAICNRHCSM